MFAKYIKKIQTRVHDILTMKVNSSFDGEITVQRLIEREWRTVKLIGQTLTGRKLTVRAAALTYTTLISLIPFLAFVFSLLTAFNVDEHVKEIILEHIPGLGTIAETVLGYIDNTNFATLGSIGLVITFWAVFKAMDSLEITINDIWGIRNRRPFLNRMSYYTSIVVMAPLIMILSFGINTVLASNTIVQRLQDIFLISWVIRFFIRLLPYLVLWLLFIFIYKVIPNTKVQFSSALFGAVVGGTLFQLMLYGYTEFQFGLSRYNVIYSSFASIPFFMVWLYTSWLMLIVGAVTAYIHQNYSHLRENAMTAYVSYSYKERLSLRAFMAIASAFYEGKKPLSIERLSQLLDVPEHLVHEMIFILRDENLISVISDEDPIEMRFQPSRDLSRIRFTEVLIALREHGDNPSEQMTEGERGFLDITLEQILRDVQAKYKDTTFDDLCREFAGRYLLEMKTRTQEKHDFFSRFF